MGRWTEYHRLYYYKRRQKLVDHLGGQCAECGATADLHFDHVDPAAKSFNISRNITLSNAEVLAELQKCQLLCRTHHEQKTAQENSGFTHGTIYAWMKARCRCDPCQSAKRTWYDARNEKRRSESNASPRKKYGRPAEHGEILSYRRGCRCTDCRAANAAYARSLASR